MSVDLVLTEEEVRELVGAAGKVDEDLLQHLTWERAHLATCQRINDGKEDPVSLAWLANQEAIVDELANEARRRGLVERSNN